MLPARPAAARRRPIDDTLLTASRYHRRAGGLRRGNLFTGDFNCLRLTMLLPFWRSAEIGCANYIRTLGYRIVASGFRVRSGEVDIIAWDGDVLVFIEVKSRKGMDPPEAAVGLRKRHRVMKAAQAYMSRHRLADTSYRFDVVTVNESPGEK